MTLFEEAVCFAVKKHSGMVRKRESKPFILHPMECAAVAGNITTDQEVLAAAVLHDTIEDTNTEISEIESLFGPRVAMLVLSETEDKMREIDPSDSWTKRKELSLEVLKNSTDIGVRILWLSDKLSNMRSFYRLYLSEGDGLWNTFHQKDPTRQAWYYRTVCEYLSPLEGTGEYSEYKKLVETVFQNVK